MFNYDKVFKAFQKATANMPIDRVIEMQSMLSRSFNKIDTKAVLAASQIKLPEAIEQQLIKNTNSLVSNEIARKYSTTAAELNNKYFYQINIHGKFLENINKIRIDYPQFLAFEDIYRNSYNNVYSKLLGVNKLKADDKCLEITAEINDAEIGLPNVKDVASLNSLFGEIPKQEILDFVSFICEFPMLGMHNETGQEIYSGLRKYIKNNTIEETGKTFYRSRAWNENQDMDYSTSEMWQAPFGLPKIGRFNPYGISHLYFADKMSVATEEAGGEKYSVMKFKSQSSLTLIDISNEEFYVFELCNKKKSSTSYNPKEYIVPNFIAQCCAHIDKFTNTKIDGIKYKSSLVSDGTCYVLFDTRKRDFCDERIVCLN